MPDTGHPPQRSKASLYDVSLDENAIRNLNKAVEHEREVAVFDLLENNYFKLPDRNDGPYRLHLSMIEQRLALQVGTRNEDNVITHMLSMTPFKRLIKDYFMICDSYYDAIKTAAPSRIQAIDMGRRGLHDDGSHLLMERLDGKIILDFETARRLFTLISVLHWRGRT
ncbi:MAG: UPF0262 family protein [Pseudomonadota bacterium]